MALKDYYNTNDDIWQQIWSGWPFGQTFTPTENYEITSVKLKLFKSGTPGTLTVGLYATSEGIPIGTVLVSGTTNGNDLTENEVGEWREITFSSPYNVVSGIQYAIVLSSTSESYPVCWRVNSDEPTYSGGALVWYYYYGGFWSVNDSCDFMFETYSSVGVENYDEGTKVITGNSSVLLTVEIHTQVIIEGIKVITGTGFLILTKESYKRYSGFLRLRPSSYDSSLVYDEITQTWISKDGRSGSRFQNKVVVLDNVGNLFVGQ